MVYRGSTPGVMCQLTSVFAVLTILFNEALSISVIAPRFTEHPESQVIRHHVKAVLHCRVTPESAQIRWIFNGSIIQSNSQAGIEINGGRLQILSFRHIRKDRQMSHEGVYQCVANNSVGVILSREATLKRAFMGQFGESNHNLEMNATEGNTAVIPCTPPRGVPPPLTEFQLNGKAIDQSSKRHRVLPSGNLQIADVKQSDKGIYKCVCINPVSNQVRISPYNVTLDVKAPRTHIPPEFVKRPVLSNKVIQGDDVTLECVVQGSPVPVIVWDNADGQLPEGRHTQFLGNLAIRDVQPSDQGTYICRAQNTIGVPMAAIAKLLIIEPPNIFIPPADQTAIDGATVAFQCIAKGDDVTTEWYFNGKILSSNPQIAITETSLTITRVTKENQGIYQCIARSYLGMTSAEALLQVKIQGELNYTWPELPRQPETMNPTTKPNMGTPSSGEDPIHELPGTNGGNRRGKDKPRKNNRGDDSNMVLPSAPEVSKESDTSVLLRWSVPPNDGLAIHFFKIQYKDVNIRKEDRQWKTYNVDTPGKRRIEVIRRLKSGTVYKFRVLAVYDNKDNRCGPPSKRFELNSDEEVTSSLVPKTGPLIVKANASAPDKMAIQWQYMQDRKNIQGFYIYYKIYNQKEKFMKHKIPGADVRRFVLRKLEPNKHYKVKMTSYNTAGEGPIGNEVVKETPGGIPPTDVSIWNSDPINAVTPSKRPRMTYPDDRQSTAKSNQMLYITLGVVLGLVLLGLLLFMFLCWRKQRKQRTALSSSQTDSLRKKPQMNGGPNFLLHDLHTNGGISGKVSNGQVTTGYGGHNGTNPMALTVNPFHQIPDQQTSQFENSGQDRIYSPEDLEIQNLRASLQEALHQPPPPIPPEQGAPQVYASVNRRNPHNYYEVDPNHQDTLPRMHMETFGGGCHECSHGSRPPSRAESHLSSQAPPDYNSLNMRGPVYSNRLSGDYRDYSGSLHRNKPMTNPYHMNKDHYRNSPDHIPRSHERPSFKSYNSQPRNIRTMPSNERYDNSPTMHDTSHGSIDPSEIYEKVSDNQSLGSQGRSRQRKPSPGIPPLLTSSLGYRSFNTDRTDRESPILRQPLPILPVPQQPLKMGMTPTPPRLPPRNITPVLYNNIHTVEDIPKTNENAGMSDSNNRERRSSSSSTGSGNDSSPKNSPQVIDDLSQDLPVISGLGDTGTDTLPSSSNREDQEVSLSETMDSDLEGMQLSDNEEEHLSSLHAEPDGSDEELAPLVLNPSQTKNGTIDSTKSNENTPLMQRNIPRANDYPSDDDNEDI